MFALIGRLRSKKAWSEASSLSVGCSDQDALSSRTRLLEDNCNFAAICLCRVEPNHHTTVRGKLPYASDVFLLLAFVLQTVEFVESVAYVGPQLQEIGSA